MSGAAGWGTGTGTAGGAAGWRRGSTKLAAQVAQEGWVARQEKLACMMAIFSSRCRMSVGLRRGGAPEVLALHGQGRHLARIWRCREELLEPERDLGGQPPALAAALVALALQVLAVALGQGQLFAEILAMLLGQLQLLPEILAVPLGELQLVAKIVAVLQGELVPALPFVAVLLEPLAFPRGRRPVLQAGHDGREAQGQRAVRGGVAAAAARAWRDSEISVSPGPAAAVDPGRSGAWTSCP